MGLSVGFAELDGTTVATAAVDIESDEGLVTLKCAGCGAPVMINTDSALQARCHWCRHTLSLSDTVPNGAVPDGILPFAVTREAAAASIAAFAGRYRWFQQRSFRNALKTANVMGVYLPYMTVDANVSVRLDGLGRKYVDGADGGGIEGHEYSVTRKLDLVVDDLLVETSSRRLHQYDTDSTGNVVSALLDFDVKNMMRFDAHFLGEEFTAERRDMDVHDAESFAVRHYFTLARAAARGSIWRYDGGVRWTSEQAMVRGSRWTSVLLPLWLYSFVETTHGQSTTHYLAVNGRTGDVKGSIPVDRVRLGVVATVVALAGVSLSWPLAVLGLEPGSQGAPATDAAVMRSIFFLAAALAATFLGPLLGWRLWRSVAKRYRNADDEYRPQRVVAHAVRTTVRKDQFIAKIDEPLTFSLGRNDHDPARPLTYVKATKK